MLPAIEVVAVAAGAHVGDLAALVAVHAALVGQPPALRARALVAADTLAHH